MAGPVDSPGTQTGTAAGSRTTRWLQTGLDLVYPPSCPLCHASIESTALGRLCPACQQELADHRPPCARCGATKPAGQAPADGCARCSGEKFHFEATLRLGRYEGLLRSAVLRIKKASQRGLALALGDTLADASWERWQALAPDAIVPVPMHWSRRLWRGANSPETLAERLANRYGVPVAAHLLVRCRRTAPQASLSATRRLANVRGAFRAIAHQDLPGARLLVVDDIMTTGATVNEAAKVLRRAGADFVGIAVLARAEGQV